MIFERIKKTIFLLSFVCSPALLFGAGTAAVPKTVITGDKMTIQKSGDIVLFEGNAKAVRGQDSVTADKVIQNKPLKIIDAYGDIYFEGVTQEGFPVKAKAQKASYDQNTDIASLSGERPWISYNNLDSSTLIDLTADKISVDNKEKTVEATGNVYVKTIRQDDSPIYAKSQNVFYNAETQIGELKGARPELEYYIKSSDSPVQLTSDKIDVFYKGGQIKAYGDVEIVTSSATILSPNALIYRENQKAVMFKEQETQPEVYAKDKNQDAYYKADKITVLMEEKVVHMKGNVIGKINVQDEDK